MAAGAQCQYRALPSLSKICVCGRHWKGGQEQAALPPSPAHLQHPSICTARWAVLSLWQMRWFSRSCRPVPCLLCLHSVSWLQPGRHLIFHFSLYCKQLHCWFTACSQCPGTAGLPPPDISVLHECWCNEAVPVEGAGWGLRARLILEAIKCAESPTCFHSFSKF